MMARQRRLGVIIVPLKFWLIPGRDDDVIDFLRTVPPGKRSNAVITAMRCGINTTNNLNLEDDESASILNSLGKIW